MWVSCPAIINHKVLDCWEYFFLSLSLSLSRFFPVWKSPTFIYIHMSAAICVPYAFCLDAFMRFRSQNLFLWTCYLFSNYMMINAEHRRFGTRNCRLDPLMFNKCHTHKKENRCHALFLIFPFSLLECINLVEQHWMLTRLCVRIASLQFGVNDVFTPRRFSDISISYRVMQIDANIFNRLLVCAFSIVFIVSTIR